MHTVLSMTLESNGALWNSPSASNLFAYFQFGFYRGLSFVRLWLLSQKMHILVTWCETLLNVYGFLMTAEDGYDSKSCWYFKT
jgi:hypothetical protein